MPPKLRALVTPIRNDTRNTLAGLRELARKAANEECPAIGVVAGIQFADNRVEFIQLGLAARNTDRAARLANQLADSLVWD